MLVHRKHDAKLYLGFRLVPFLKKRFVWKVDFVKVSPLNFFFLWVMTFYNNFLIIIV